MEVVKKNMLSLICGVVALLAIAAQVWPLDGMYDVERGRLDGRKKAYDDLVRVKSSPRSWPVIPKLDSKDSQPLREFPAQPYIESGKLIKAEVQRQATDIKETTNKNNEHRLLIDALPVPGVNGYLFQKTYLDDVQKRIPGELVGNLVITVTGSPTGGTFILRFRDQPTVPIAYNAGQEVVQAALATLTGVGNVSVSGSPGGPWTVAFIAPDLSVGETAKLTGGVSPTVTIETVGRPPTEADIHAEANRLWEAEFKTKILAVAGQAMNRPQVEADWKKRCETLQSTMRLQRARECKLYLEPDALSVNKAMLAGGGQAPEAKKIWYAQTMLWLQRDVVSAIVKANGNRSVIDAPVKHLLRLEVPEDLAQYVTNSATGEAGKIGDASGHAYSRSPTGRICNPVYDVIQFGLVMDVEAGKVAEVLAELQRGRLITVQQCDVAAVDGIGIEDDGFIYGDVPVVRVTLHGEELFLRDWTVKYMPEDVKKELSVQPGSNQGPR